MGPSGSGKTTLLNILSCKIKSEIQGSIHINGQSIDKKLIKEISGFVPQEDIVYGSQKVREALKFYCDLKLSKNLSTSEKSNIIDDVLLELGLNGISKSIIGYVGADASSSSLPRGISGGERKRLSIGCQIISNPSLLFLDEPTTGLDSFASQSVIDTLSKISKKGRTIILTIHQPSIEILNLFDTILMLGKGKTIYFGTMHGIMKYFTKIGYPCAVWQNPTDHIINVIHGDQTESYDQSEAQATKLSNLFLTKHCNIKMNKTPDSVTFDKKIKRVGCFRSTLIILKRSINQIIREPNSVAAGLFLFIFIALLLGLTFLMLGYNEVDLTNRTGALFFSVVFVSYSEIISPFYSFGNEKRLFVFQIQEGLFSSLAYYCSKVLIETFLIFINISLFTIIFYNMCNFRNGADHFFMYYIVLLINANVAFSYGLLLIIALPSTKVALQLFVLFYLPFMIFSGFYLNKSNTPVYFIWVQYISFINYSFQIIMNNEFTNENFYCTTDEFLNYNNTLYCPYTTGNAWLDFYHMKDFPIFGDFLILIEMLILFLLLGYLFLKISKSYK